MIETWLELSWAVKDHSLIVREDVKEFWVSKDKTWSAEPCSMNSGGGGLAGLELERSFDGSVFVGFSDESDRRSYFL